jgi:hypothetical protein
VRDFTKLPFSLLAITLNPLSLNLKGEGWGEGLLKIITKKFNFSAEWQTGLD